VASTLMVRCGVEGRSSEFECSIQSYAERLGRPIICWQTYGCHLGSTDPMDINSSESLQLLARLEALHWKCRPGELWRIERESHDYPDGTTHFTHVVTTSFAVNNEPVKVVIGKYLTPELAELLVLMRNNLPDLLKWAQAATDST
jgi:hypothetical protein